MARRNLTAVLLAPLLAAFVLLLMSVDNPFSIAFAAILILSQVPLIRWILGFELGQAVPVRAKR